mmetsp:Transcript_11243/g.45727  ORF Transcript_11243/g.45727 Transcript_11243/m.45727 type:complete len:220 (-) Transcript_11243:485-1144(-)
MRSEQVDGPVSSTSELVRVQSLPLVEEELEELASSTAGSKADEAAGSPADLANDLLVFRKDRGLGAAVRAEPHVLVSDDIELLHAAEHRPCISCQHKGNKHAGLRVPQLAHLDVDVVLLRSSKELLVGADGDPQKLTSIDELRDTSDTVLIGSGDCSNVRLPVVEGNQGSQGSALPRVRRYHAVEKREAYIAAQRTRSGRVRDLRHQKHARGNSDDVGD